QVDRKKREPLMEFFPEIELSKQAAEAMARALFTVAKSDGLHAREPGPIASFWLDMGHEAAALPELERSPVLQPAELQQALASAEERRLFLKTAFLLTWADGKVSVEERETAGQ